MVTREDIEKELERLNEQLEIKISRVNILKQTLAEQTNELIAIKGAIEQTNKILALYNNENENKEENNNE